MFHVNYDLNSAIKTNNYNVVNILLANIKARMFKNEINKEEVMKDIISWLNERQNNIQTIKNC